MKNTVSLIGRIGGDPELKKTDSGKAVCNLSLATTAKWTNEKNEKIEKTEWHRLVFWGRQAEVVAEFSKKGNLLAIDGRIEYREFKDKENQPRYATDIVVENFYFITPKTVPA